MVSLTEKGERDTTGTTLEAWATACGARLVLLREGEELAALSPAERDLVLAWRRLRSADRGYVMDLVNRLLPSTKPVLMAADGDGEEPQKTD